ncbi:glycosyltransferase family 2 protein [Leptospira gomenensis]|uniref:Glycosyltransferase family 2 protein n=1 Tax=Leptospira gomenensis TaxID=2484974 RepID=A0A5F1YRX3_9LEPT|nr:glycosyltransferase family 2 protein [Leptospira gomenensis]TGK38674.1 glycosyltransferase family 2 protein [Leptospira gomenensis]TGK44336.1 glycosyltransferase family 2 protein [Leptospira gomenensis]TGK49544.1 glycosyltransferase family 2 protein [Leptospira gomenensis]TGK60786.1 glycosyltransferase family 2 protein [Leptospira gomenensis]
MTSSLPLISIIVPTYNEKENLPILLPRIESSLQGHSFEIIVVDDNSPDRTWEIAEGLKEKHPGLKVLRRMDAQGLSSAVIAGMGFAKGQVFVVMDADLQHDERILPRLIDEIVSGRADLSVGTRYSDGSSTSNWSKTRRFFSVIATRLAKSLLPLPVSDPMSGFFAISRNHFENTVEKIHPRGFKIFLEFLSRPTRPPRVSEIPFAFQNRRYGQTKLDGSVIRNYLVAVLDLRFGKRISPTFLLYSLVGSFGVLVNLTGLLIGEFLEFPELEMPFRFLNPFPTSVLFGIEISILSNFLCNNYLTFYEKRYSGFKLSQGLILFHLVSLLGLTIQVSVFQFLYHKIFLSELNSSGILIKLICDLLAISAAMITNYFLNLNVTWKGSRD